MQGIIEWFQSSATCLDPSESLQGPQVLIKASRVLISTTQQELTPEVAIELSGPPCSKTLKTNQLVIDQSDIIRDPSTLCMHVCVRVT